VKEGDSANGQGYFDGPSASGLAKKDDFDYN